MAHVYRHETDVLKCNALGCGSKIIVFGFPKCQIHVDTQSKQQNFLPFVENKNNSVFFLYLF